jgi:hypothetical protein
MSNLSPSTLALLRAAKNDAPSKESRHAIWGGVTSGLVTHTPLHIRPQGQGPSAAPPPVAAPAAAATKGLATAAGLTGMKGAFVGALFGSAISIGVATFMLRTKPVDVPRAPLAAQATTQAGDASKVNSASATNAKTAAVDPNAASPMSASAPVIELGASNATPITATADKSGSTVNSAGSSVSGSDVRSSKTSSSNNAKSMTDDTQSLHSKKSATTDSTDVDDDTLSRETDLVKEGNSALRRGDPIAALKAMRAARSLEKRQWEPNEMAIEARALHALGRDDEAAKIEARLRAMYPSQPL